MCEELAVGLAFLVELLLPVAAFCALQLSTGSSVGKGDEVDRLEKLFALVVGHRIQQSAIGSDLLELCDHRVEFSVGRLLVRQVAVCFPDIGLSFG